MHYMPLMSGCPGASLRSLALRKRTPWHLSTYLLFKSTFGHGSLLLLLFRLFAMTLTSYNRSRRRWILPFQNTPVLNLLDICGFSLKSSLVWHSLIQLYPASQNEQLKRKAWIILQCTSCLISGSLRTCLLKILSKNTMDFFRCLMPAVFLDSDAESWELREDYREAWQTVEHLKMVNDNAERCVSLIAEYNAIITKKQF